MPEGSSASISGPSAGPRFAGTTAEAAWLGAGDLIEVGDHAIEIMQLRVNGAILNGPLADDDPLGLVETTDGKPINDLTLRLIDDSDANWSIGSSLVFLAVVPPALCRWPTPRSA